VSAAPLAGFWDWWWWSPPRRWYSIEISDPVRGERRYLSPRELTDRQATEWRLDVLEQYWGHDVARLVWTGSYWARG
jgi:hypothetical protein